MKKFYRTPLSGKFSAGVYYGGGGQFAAGVIDTVPLNNSTYNGFEIVLPWKRREKELD
jgi:hypothetical protein